MKPALPPVGLLKAPVELLEVQLWVGAQVQHPSVEVLQPEGKGHDHRGVPIQLGELPEDVSRRGHFGRAGQREEAHGDVEAGGGAPVGRRGR